jgi:hypothetical protein
MLISLDFRTRSFLTHSLNAEPDFLFFLIHFDDLEVVLLSRLEQLKSAEQALTRGTPST